MVPSTGIVRWLYSCLFALTLGGCSSWEINELANNLPAAGPAATLKHLEARSNKGLDRVQVLLDKGVLKFYTGDLDGAIADLELAKSLMQSLDATSFTENIAAVTTNETLRSYKGSATDHTMVHVILALAYLFNNDLNGARVEMLQADLTMKRQSQQDSLQGQLASARFLAGVIFELNQEYSDALIAYRHAYQILTHRGESIPQALQVMLLRLTQRLGLESEFDEFQRQFGASEPPYQRHKIDYLMVYFDGVVSNKTEARLSVASGNTMVSIAVPSYPSNRYYPKRFSLQSETGRHTSQIIENLELRAREDLEADKVKIVATATARAVAKNQFVQNSQEQSPWLGLLANVITVVSEQADIRSWNMLPSAIQVARLSTQPNTELSIPEQGIQLPPINSESLSHTSNLVVIWTSDLVTQSYIYPVNSPPPMGAFNANQP